MIAPITAGRPARAKTATAATTPAGRKIPVVGYVAAGGVVTLNAGGLEWLDAVQRRIAAQKAATPA